MLCVALHGAPEMQPSPSVDAGLIEQTLRAAHADVDRDLARLEDPQARADAVGRLAMLYHAQNHLAEAAELYSQAIREYSAPRWRYLHAVTLTDLGSTDAAIAEYQRALATEDNPLFWYRLGIALLLKGDHDAATRALAQALEGMPASAAVLAELGEAAMAAGDWSRAKAWLEKAVAVEPSAGRIAYRLALTYRQLGDHDQARQWLERRNDTPPPIDDPLLLAVAELALSAKFFRDAGDRAWRRGEREEALAAYGNAARLAPRDTHIGLGHASALGELGQGEAALSEVRRVLAIDPDSARGWYLLAHLLTAQNNIDEALTAAQRSLGLADDETTRTLHGALLMRSSRFDDAAREYRSLSAKRPDAAYYRYWLGMARLAAGDCGSARPALAAALARQTNWGQAHIALARADALCGDDAARRSALRRATGLVEASDDVDTRITLAFAELAAGDRQAARALAQRALPHDDAKMLLDAIDQDERPSRPFAPGSAWWLPQELRRTGRTGKE